MQQQVSVGGIEGREAPVSGILMRPAGARVLLVLAHGAGAGMSHAFMAQLAARLAAAGIASLRFQFPYMEDGRRRPDMPRLATASVAAAVSWALAHEPRLAVVCGGKSFGGRMATTAAAAGMIPAVKGIVCYGFPLHQAKKPAMERAKHLQDVEAPLLFLQGTRDALADLPLMKEVARQLPRATLHVVEGADHGFEVLKSSGRSASQVIDELAQQTRTFFDGLGL
jgi:hypothetical protein